VGSHLTLRAVPAASGCSAAAGVHPPAVAALEATLSPAQKQLYNTVSDATSDRDATHQEWIAAEMARHAPGLSTIIRLLWVHAIAEGLSYRSFCCTVAEGFEP
jgi:hypothetical protein